MKQQTTSPLAQAEAKTETAEHLEIQLSLRRSEAFTLTLNLQLPKHGISVLFGPSGSGKTSVLRCVAGLEKAQGQIAIGKQVWQNDATGVFLPTWQRDLGYVFQEASLFSHLNVCQNLHFGMLRAKKANADHALANALQLLGIEHLQSRTPNSLSGGERQRVAIARALCTQPQLLLLDEPLAALDYARRQEVLPWLERMRQELRIPILYVTHSSDELARLADHVVCMEQGQASVHGPIATVLSHPTLSQILGEKAGVVLTGNVVSRDAQWDLAQVQTESGTLWIRDPHLAIGYRLRLRILAKDVSLSLNPVQDSSIQNSLAGQIKHIASDQHPALALVHVRCENASVLARVTQKALHQLKLTVGIRVFCHIKSVALLN